MLRAAGKQGLLRVKCREARCCRQSVLAGAAAGNDTAGAMTVVFAWRKKTRRDARRSPSPRHLPLREGKPEPSSADFATGWQERRAKASGAVAMLWHRLVRPLKRLESRAPAVVTRVRHRMVDFLTESFRIRWRGPMRPITSASGFEQFAFWNALLSGRVA